MIKWDVNDPLALCENEPIKANGYLQMYYHLGHNRSFLALCQLDDCDLSERQIARYSSDFEWQSRVKAQHILDATEARESLLELRLEALQKFGQVLIDALDNADTKDSSLTQLSSGLKTFVDSFGSIFDMLPTQRKRVEHLNLNELSFADVLEKLQSVEK